MYYQGYASSLPRCISLNFNNGSETSNWSTCSELWNCLLLTLVSILFLRNEHERHVGYRKCKQQSFVAKGDMWPKKFENHWLASRQSSAWGKKLCVNCTASWQGKELWFILCSPLAYFSITVKSTIISPDLASSHFYPFLPIFSWGQEGVEAVLSLSAPLVLELEIRQSSWTKK